MLLLERGLRCDGRRVGGVQESCPFGVRFGKVPVGCRFGRERGEVGSAGGRWGEKVGRWAGNAGEVASCVRVVCAVFGWLCGCGCGGRRVEDWCRLRRPSRILYMSLLVDDSEIFHMYRLGGKRHRITLGRCRFRLSSSGGEGFHGTARAASNVTERIATYLRGGPKKADQRKQANQRKDHVLSRTYLFRSQSPDCDVMAARHDLVNGVISCWFHPFQYMSAYTSPTLNSLPLYINRPRRLPLVLRARRRRNTL